MIGKKNGCIPIHDTIDVTSIRIGYLSASVNPTEVRNINDAFQNITDAHVQEAQFRGFPPWKNEAFKNQHREGLDLSIIDISGLTSIFLSTIN